MYSCSHLTAALGPYQRPWSADEDTALRDGWEQRRPLAELAAACNVEEHVLVRRLVQLELASGVVDATDRLGCTPGSVAATRRALALDAARTQVQVLVVIADDALLHVSLHAQEHDALTVRDRVVAAQRETGILQEINWSVTTRQVDDASTPTRRPRSGRIRVQGDTTAPPAP